MYKLSEKQVLDAITSVLMENRKVLKIGNGQAPSVPPASDMGTSQAPMEDPMAAMDQMGGLDGGAPDMAADPNAQMDGGETDNQFDTNFDAGVEADEETDPQHYIQQLTGKLSQSINSFNSEQGPDAGLCKYVASMIIAATCKNLDEKAKKELIEKINTAASDEETPEEAPEEPMGDGGEEMEQQPEQQEPMMERFFTKKDLVSELGLGVQDRQDNLQNKTNEKTKSIFGGKTFN